MNDFATIKYNSSCVEQWSSRYNGPQNANDEARSIAVDDSGNVYITGNSPGIGTAMDYATIKYNSAGFEQWVSRYNGTINAADFSRSIKVDNAGNSYVTGSSGSFGGTKADYATVKYNSLGVQQWAQRYNGPPGNGNDKAISIVLDNLGNVYVTGTSTGSGSSDDFATIKYSQTRTDIDDIKITLPEKYSLLQNYPNPFNPSTKISWQSPVGSWQTLKVYDILRNEVANLVNEYREAGSYEFEFNPASPIGAGSIKNLSSGIYFYQLRVGDPLSGSGQSFVETKKMILLK
jgi:hypothetical protein